MDFLHASIDFFKETRTSHMGAYQYADHAGIRNGKSVSGAHLWAEIEANELGSSDANIMSSEETLAQQVARDIYKYVPERTPVLEMGPGTANAFKKKVLRILMSLRSLDYICVDNSRGILEKIIKDQALSGFNVSPILDDFFEQSPCYYKSEEQRVLICMFGSTIGNMVAPLSDNKPEEALKEHLSNLARKICQGWLLISYDANFDGKSIQEYYSHHTAFHLNIFDRMAVELPISGDFDPCAFVYEPLWKPSSGQMAHMACVTKNMNFKIGEEEISLYAGQKLHIKNSFKFTQDFFEHCCARSGLEVVKRWNDPSLTNVLLLKKRIEVSSQPIPLPMVANF